MEHSANVTLVGLEIFRGKQLREGGVTPLDWLHFAVALVCRDVGYVRGLCPLYRTVCTTTKIKDLIPFSGKCALFTQLSVSWVTESARTVG